MEPVLRWDPLGVAPLTGICMPDIWAGIRGCGYLYRVWNTVYGIEAVRLAKHWRSSAPVVYCVPPDDSLPTLCRPVIAYTACTRTLRFVLTARVNAHGAWRALTRVDDLNWLFSQAVIQALPHPRKADTFEIVHTWRASRALTRAVKTHLCADICLSLIHISEPTRPY